MLTPKLEPMFEIHRRMRRTYWPEESRLKCEWLDCVAGLGLAGSGLCHRGGAWWMQCCPVFRDELEMFLR